jgi:hypothetical protein
MMGILISSNHLAFCKEDLSDSLMRCMADYPPKLVRVTETAFGSLLALSDSREVHIDVRPDRLSHALVAFERPPLAALLAAQSLDVYAGTWETAAQDWERISAAILASPAAAAAFGDVPSVWGMFGQPAAFVRELPQRVYGGLDQALYTCHRFQFQPDPNRPAPWCRSLLSASGGRLFNTWVHLNRGQVEVESEILPGHFVE